MPRRTRKRRSASAPPARRAPHWLGRLAPEWIVGGGLALLTVAVYWQVGGHDFVNYDDYAYVTHNEMVRAGWSKQGVAWAFTTTLQGHWHPLTWLSHMTDVQLFGVDAGWHHLSSLALHVLNTLLLFWVLRRMTGARWRSAFVAALFALHPLHVESVAWLADRKDLLAAFFWLLTLCVYVAYAERPSVLRYAGVALTFCLGLMAKSIVMVLPLVLLVLDFWPLGRLRWQTLADVLGRGRSLADRLRASVPALRLVAEKIPLLLVAAAVGRLALASMLEAHSDSHASGGFELRSGALLDVPTLYGFYLGRTLWPRHLAVPYPRPEPGVVEALGVAALLLAVTAAALVWLRRRPYLASGWLWFGIGLVPVVGLLRSGPHSPADRYSYLPLIGLFLLLTWAAAEAVERWRPPRALVAVCAGAILVACAASSWLQLQHWRNSLTLFEHTLAVTQGNTVAHNQIGIFLIEAGRLAEAGPHFEAVVALDPDDARGQFNLGQLQYARGEMGEAILRFTRAVELDPTYERAHRYLAGALAESGQLEQAVRHYRKAVELEPGADNHYALGRVLERLGRTQEALHQYRLALELEPGHASARARLAEWRAR